MILLLLGAPGSGKGTVSSILIEKHGFRQISTGDLLRAEVKSGSQLGKEIDAIMKSGAFVSADLVNNLVKTYIKQYQEQGKNIVLDGYPRNIEQANFLSTYANVDKVAQLVVDHQVLIDRISGRRVCPICNFAYNLNTTTAYYPEVKDGKFYCKKCQVELIQRKDDNPETVKNRLAVYEEQTLPLVKYYTDKGVLTQFDSSKGTEGLVKEILA
ncbi:MAG: nucleoside monophosphate kinase [Mycoplasmataceae bacterium]|jgi:adenylate kinase|nr:nucleoside monophosphate kinase [Mycoplasmataceae bacterium]